MSINYNCDRCNKTYEGLGVTLNFSYMGLQLARKLKIDPLKRIDLCQDCLEDFKKFLQEKKV